MGEYASLERAQEHALVILAMDLSCWLGRGGDGYVLLADPGQALAISAELEAYEAEQRDGRAGGAVEVPHFGAAPWLAFAWCVVLMAVFLWQGDDPGVTAVGKSSSLAIYSGGEWWRAFTALFLHADLGHLMSNLASGFAVALLACRSAGRWLAWPLMFLSGVAGNLWTAAAHFPDPATSLGASTLVFGGLGLLTGFGFYVAFRMPSASPWASVLAPVGGGIALLGLTGAGGPEVDVLAHLTGFAAGLPAGAAAAWWRLRGVSPSPSDRRPA